MDVKSLDGPQLYTMLQCNLFSFLLEPQVG